MNNKIISKIAKLLALSESPNEFEAKAAMLKAQELLIKHKMTIKDIKEYNNEKTNVIENLTSITFTKAKWKGKLAYVIAENFGCYSFFRTLNTNRIVFMGKEEDATICTIVMEYAVDCINDKVKKLRYEYLKAGYSTKGLESDYALGFISGLNTAFENQKEDNQDWGLILVKDQVIIDKYNSIHFKKLLNTDMDYQGFDEVYCSGVEDGENFSINRISGKEKEILKLEQQM